MTKLMLAGVAALALSAGAAFAGTEPPASDYGRAPAQYTQLMQHYDYLAQQQRSPSWDSVLQDNNAVPVISGYDQQNRHRYDCWPYCP